MSIVALSETPILSFLNNAGQLNAGGSLLTQVGGVNYPTYQDPNGSTPLPNPIPLNSRGEISNAAGTSCQLFLISGITYDFTLFDANGNQLWTASNVMALAPVAVGSFTDENGSNGQPGFSAANGDFVPGTTTQLTLSKNYGSASNLFVAFDAGEQGAGTFSIGGTNNETLTFNAPIPVGTQMVYVKGGLSLAIGAPAPGTVTDVSISTGTKLYNRINDVISVDDPQFGAQRVACGSTPTVDATAAFQAAVNAAVIAGLTEVQVPSGAYLIAGQITMPQGVRLVGTSKRGTIIPTTSQAQFGTGSIIYLNNLAQSPFLYQSGNGFIGLTFYHPAQLRTLSTPLVYPYVFTPNPAELSEIMVDVLWRDVQFVNAYQGINAQCSHLDFEFNRIQGFCISNAINIDGGGGTDYLNQINLSYYYFGQVADAINVWCLAHGVILQIGRSDDIDMQEVFIGTGFIALQTYIGSVNSAWGPYGNIRGLSIDSCTNGIVSLGTNFVGFDVHGFLCNTTAIDFQSSTAVSRWQFTGFKTWGPRSESFLTGFAGNFLKLSDGEILSGYTTDAIRCIANTVDLAIDNVLFQGAAPSIVTNGYVLNSLLITNCSMVSAGAPNLNGTAATNQVIKDNIGLNNVMTTIASAGGITVQDVGDSVNLTGTTTVVSIAGGWPGRRVYFRPSSGSVNFGTGGNILGNLTLLQNIGAEYYCDGTNWSPMCN